MDKSSTPKIVFSERLSNGVMVHFEDGLSVLYSAQFLYECRNAPQNKVFGNNGSNYTTETPEKKMTGTS